MEISITVNGRSEALDVPDNALLVEVLRERLGLTALMWAAIPASAALASFT